MIPYFMYKKYGMWNNISQEYVGNAIGKQTLDISDDELNVFLY